MTRVLVVEDEESFSDALSYMLRKEGFEVAVCPTGPDAIETFDRTGVEMEALTSCAIAALTIYDMCKSSDRSMTIGELCLWEKTGGRSGSWRRRDEAAGGALPGSFDL